jgi:hypothetical protein
MKVRFDKKLVFKLLILILLAAACTPENNVLPTATPTPVTALPLKTAGVPQPDFQSETQTPLPLVLPVSTGKILSSGDGTTVNVRGGPGTIYERIGMLAGGKVVQVTGRSPSGDWWRVRADGIEGWVFSSYVVIEGNGHNVPCVAGVDGVCATAQIPPGNDQAIASIQKMFENKDLALSFREENGNPNADMRRTLIYSDDQGGEYWVDGQTFHVVQWLPGQATISSEVKNFEALLRLARSFADRQSPRFRLKVGTLSFTETSKDGLALAFRWEDRSISGHSLFPFLQIVMRTDGQILSYMNTLDILIK